LVQRASKTEFNLTVKIQFVPRSKYILGNKNPQSIRWLGHVKRKKVGVMPRKMMEGRLFIGRRKGRPRLRWMDDDVADLKVMKIKQWMENTKDRGQWRLVVEEAKAHTGL
jgi:hypothetical protein